MRGMKMRSGSFYFIKKNYLTAHTKPSDSLSM